MCMGKCKWCTPFSSQESVRRLAENWNALVRLGGCVVSLRGIMPPRLFSICHAMCIIFKRFTADDVRWECETHSCGAHMLITDGKILWKLLHFCARASLWAWAVDYVNDYICARVQFLSVAIEAYVWSSFADVVYCWLIHVGSYAIHFIT